jgi:hypothetical protein
LPRSELEAANVLADILKPDSIENQGTEPVTSTPL